MGREVTPAVTVRDLRIEMTSGAPVVMDVSFDIQPGEILGVVGESGSGKTTVALALLGHARKGLRIAGGSILLGDHDVLAMPENKRRTLRGAVVSYVPQDPASSLNPAMRIGVQLREVLQAHGSLSRRKQSERIAEMMREVALPDDQAYLRRYPHELSGGQQQRIGLAMAFANRPRLIVLDEPTTGLDVTTQAKVLQTVREMTAAYDVAALYVSHDLAVVATVARRVAVMNAGRIVELGSTEKLFRSSAHPYTRQLISAIPRLTGPMSGDPLDTPVADDQDVMLSLRGVTARYGHTEVLHSVDLDLHHHECIAVVGESGSGKTTTARSIVGLHPHWSGSMRLGDQELATATRSRSADTRRQIQYIFQNPYGSLNPRKSVGESVRQPLETFGLAKGRKADNLVGEMLEQVSLSAKYASTYPDQLSGGERQRVAIARALIVSPSVLICDEVTSALDVISQAAIVELLAGLRREFGLAMIFVTHNLPLVRSIAQRVIALSDGKLIEQGDTADLLAHPRENYTQQLIADTPALDTIPFN